MKQFHCRFTMLVPAVLTHLNDCKPYGNNNRNRFNNLEYDFNGHGTILSENNNRVVNFEVLKPVSDERWWISK